MEPIPVPGLLTALVASLVPLVLFVGVVRIVVSTGWLVPGRWALTLSSPVAPLAAAVVTGALTWWVWGSLDEIPVIHDEQAYVLQARIFALGRWTGARPPLPEFFEQMHVFVDPHVAAKYPPGHALLLTPGIWLDLPGFMPVVMTAVAAGLVFGLARALADVDRSVAVTFRAWRNRTSSPTTGLALPLGPAWSAWALLYVPLLMVGVWESRARGPRLSLLFGLLYLGLVVLHPFAPYRYLLPLIPLVVVLVLQGAEVVAQVVSRWLRAHARPGVAGFIMAATILLPNLWLLALAGRDHPDAVRGWYGRDLGYRWSGFEETFAWIRSNTRQDDVLGTMFDGSYFLHTGRRAIRPWMHHPETYFYPVGRAQPFVGEPRTVLAEMRALGVTHVVLDPATGSVAGEAVVAMLRALLALPEAASTPVFTSADGRHEVYRLRAASPP